MILSTSANNESYFLINWAEIKVNAERNKAKNFILSCFCQIVKLLITILLISHFIFG